MDRIDEVGAENSGVRNAPRHFSGRVKSLKVV